MNAYWPWWLGALALGALCVGFACATGRAMGVSGIFGRLVGLRVELETERADAALDGDEAGLQRALLAATAEAMGVAVELLAPEQQRAQRPSPERVGASPAPRPPLLAHGLFLAGILSGAALSQGWRVARGLPLPTQPASIIHLQGWALWGSLAVGGVLVGAGTTISGGCSSGHGLSGCARLQPGSLAATASFFAAAAAVTWLCASRGY